MLFQGNELAVTQGGRSAPKVHFWSTFFTRWRGVKMTSAKLHMVMNEARALGMSASSIHTRKDENAQGSEHLRKQPKKGIRLSEKWLRWNIKCP